jgi:hypothetical protein
MASKHARNEILVLLAASWSQPIIFARRRWTGKEILMAKKRLEWNAQSTNK